MGARQTCTQITVFHILQHNKREISDHRRADIAGMLSALNDSRSTTARLLHNRSHEHMTVIYHMLMTETGNNWAAMDPQLISPAMPAPMSCVPASEILVFLLMQTARARPKHKLLIICAANAHSLVCPCQAALQHGML